MLRQEQDSRHPSECVSLLAKLEHEVLAEFLLTIDSGLQPGRPGAGSESEPEQQRADDLRAPGFTNDGS